MRNAPISYDSGMAPILAKGGVSGGVGSIVYAEIAPSDGAYFQCNGQVIAYPKTLPFQATSFLPTIGKKTGLPLATTGTSNKANMSGVLDVTYDGAKFWIAQSDDLYVSTDLVTFTKVTGMTLGMSGQASSLSFDGVRLIKGYYPGFATAPASVTGSWTEHATVYGSGQPGSYFESIAVSGDGRYFVAGQAQKMGQGWNSGNQFLANGDGSTAYNGVCWDGSRFIVTGRDVNGNPYLYFWDSPSPTAAATNTLNLYMNAAPLNLGAEALHSIAYGAGRYMAITYSGKVIVCTSDPKVLANWSVATTLSSFTQRPGTMLAYGAGMFVLVGNLGQVRYSSNGVSWTTVTPFDSGHLLCVNYLNGKWILGGASGLYELFLAESTYTLPTLPVQVSKSNAVLKPYLRVA